MLLYQKAECALTKNSPDGNSIFDFIPETTNAFALGGGSGHGFKHSPALGKLVADALSGKEKIPSLFRLIPTDIKLPRNLFCFKPG